MTTRPAGKGWNLFARELEAILRAHGSPLGHLTTRVGIHTEKVRRLRQSLTSRTFHFHLLNPQELEEIILAFQLTGEEQLRLRAALLATAIEELLMNRIDPESALQVAEEVFPLLLLWLRQRVEQQQGLTTIRGRTDMHEPTLDEMFEPILAQLNHGLLALYLGEQGSLTERLEHHRNALKSFLAVQEALEMLCKQEPDLKADAIWQLWYSEAQHNLSQAQQSVEHLEP